MTVTMAAALTLSLGLATLAGPAQAEAPAEGLLQKPLQFPLVKMLQPQRGAAAVTALGSRLPEVAAWYGMSAQRLSDILQNDSTAWLDRDGRLFHVESPAPAAASQPQAAALPQPAAFPLDQTFLLHSKPGSQRVIYLDFDGHTVTGTSWKAGTINAKPYDTDGDPASFSDEEREEIQLAWQQAANDYAPFDVDVTTEEPAAAAIDRNNSADQAYGTRAVITDNDFGACASCGGIAYVDVFDTTGSDHAYYQPAWVFNQNNGKVIGETISHEVGHNLGLSHDGKTLGATYYAGHGDGPTGWGPIMGAVFDRELSQWSKGEYPSANNKEDDLALISSNGAPYRADDFAQTYAGGYAGLAALDGSDDGSTVSVDQGGLIERTADTDDFAFEADDGSASFSVEPMSAPGVNLDTTLALYDSLGNLIASANDLADVNATITTNLARGSYFLRVGSTGDSSPAPGYSNYGSLGEYRVTGSYALQGPDDVPDSFSFTAQTNVAPSTKRSSNTITVSGLDAGVTVPISVTGGTYSIGCLATGFTAQNKTIGNGQTVCVRHMASASPSTTVTTTLSIGDVDGGFSSTTAAADTTPDNFGFTAQTDVPLSTKRTSNTIAISGLAAAAPISVSGGTYSIGCSETGFTAQTKTISNGQTVCVRHTASAAAGATVTTTLSIGGINGTFSSTTVAPDTTPDSFAFTAQTGVALSTKATSNTIVISGLAAAAPISVSGGTYSIGCSATGFTAQAKTISNGQSVCVRHVSSANAATTVTTMLSIGGVSGDFSSTTAP